MAFFMGCLFMKILNRNLYAVALTILIIGGATACASKEKAAAGPDTTRAAEVKQAPDATQAAAHGTVEIQPSADELKHQQDQENARLKQAELDRLKEEEATRVAAAATLSQEKLEKVYFDFDKYEIGQAYRAPLERNATAIKNHSGTKIVVEGHCDERGTEEYNLALGERRAMAVKTYLASLGVSEGQLYTISYGEERPAENGHDKNAWSQNRRVQFSRE